MKKRPEMFFTILGLWFLVVLYFNPRIFTLLIGRENLFAKLSLIIFVICLDISWLYVFFHSVIIIFSYFTCRDEPPRFIASVDTLPKVALLYATCNDFQEEAARSHLCQDYPNFHLFILDDSSQISYQKQIDNFASQYVNTVTVIRRDNQDGFKAGNLNHGLRRLDKEYAYFSVSDADTVLPSGYIRGLLPYVLKPSTAFAQSAQASNPKQSSVFARYLGLNTDIHFRHYASTKNRYGFVMWYGHGALMRRDVWRKMGGFPEIATEDLAYSMKIREAGYEGVFVGDVVCLEDFPPTYLQYRRRNEKWIRGTAECLVKFYPAFLKTGHIPWFEKADVLISAISLLLALPFLLFIFISGVILPLYFSSFQFQGPMIRIPILYDKTALALLTQLRGNLFWSWDVFLLMLASIFTPLLAAFIDYWKTPGKIVCYSAGYIFNFFSLQVVSALHLVVFLLTGKAVFPVTGDYHIQKGQAQANLRWVLWLELLCGAAFCVIAFITQNIWLFPLALALCLSILLYRWNLELPLMRYVIPVPLMVLLGIIYFLGRGLQLF